MFSRIVLGLQALVLVAALAGCEKPAPPRPVFKASATWEGNTLTIKGAATSRACDLIPCRLSLGVLLGPERLAMALLDGDPGTEAMVRFGGAPPRPLRWPTEGPIAFPLTRAQLGGVELATGAVRLGTLRVELGGHDPLDVDLVPMTVSPVAALFSVGQPLTFADEVDAPGKTTFFIANPERPMLASRAIGPGTQARDVDFLVVEERRKTGERTCAGYRTTSGVSATTTVFAYDSNLRVFDRRTGAVVKEQLLEAGAPQCPNLAFGSAYGVGKSTTTISDRAIEAWVNAAAK